MPTPRSNSRPASPRPAANVPEIVDPRWILKALAGVIVVAIGCAYLTVCGIFFYGQWQIVLQPSRTVSRSPRDVGLSFSEVHFGDDASGQPQLDGWWIPSDTASAPTVLMLHSGQGSMSDALPAAHALHNVELNILLFDYRGFGRSGGQHPTEALMKSDSDAALRYLTDSRHIPPSSLIVYGSGVGGSLAVRLCSAHAELPAMILESPDGDFEARVRHDSRARMVPVGLLFNDNFPLTSRLGSLATPKLLMTYTGGSAPLDFARAADPKMTVEFAAPNETAEHQALRRFLDTYITHAPPTLLPNH